jgi:DNA-binding response OmpR family regulator
VDILVVEDDRDLCDTIVDSLKEWGVHTTGVYSGTEAIDVLYEHSYDILILDINLPGADGFSVLKEARQCYPCIGSIFMTT